MICPKCGNDCQESKFCPKCGTKLFRECRKCHRVLNENETFCPECGADNTGKSSDKTNNNVNLIGFILTVVFAGIRALGLLSFNGYFSFWLDDFFYDFPFLDCLIGLAVIYISLIICAVLFRIKKRNGYGIAAIVLAGIIKLISIFSFSSLVILAGTIMSFVAKKNSDKNKA